jgi:hypothetical protein
MEIATCEVVALSEDVRNIVAAGLKALGMEATLVASPEELPTVLEKIPALRNPVGSNYLDKSFSTSQESHTGIGRILSLWQIQAGRKRSSDTRKRIAGECCPRSPVVESENAANVTLLLTGPT